MYNGKEDYSEGYIRAWWPYRPLMEINIDLLERDVDRTFEKDIPNEKGVRYVGGEARMFVMYKYDLELCMYILRNQDEYGILDLEVRV